MNTMNGECRTLTLGMSAKFGTVDVVYSKVHDVILRTSDKDERKYAVRISIELQSVTNPSTRKELYVQLTDDKDPLFFFSLRLAEEDFQNLKTQQGLLVDFHSFPAQFTQLLDKCQTDADVENPRFVLRISGINVSNVAKNDAVLEIVEANPFKHLCHLQLLLAAGTDTQVKQYLANFLKKLKAEKDVLSNQLESTQMHLEKELTQCRSMLAQKTSELEHVRLECKDETVSLSTKLASAVSAEKEKAMTLQHELQNRHDHERHELQTRYLQTTQQMETRILGLETENRDLVDKKYKNEAAIRDLRSQVVALEDDVQRFKQDISALRSQNNSLDSSCHEKDNVIHDVSTRVAVLQQEVKDKEMLLQRQQELLAAGNEQKVQLEDQLDQRHGALQRREISLKSMSEELVKANEIIKKLQGEIRLLHSKVKLRSQIAAEQEKLLHEKDRELLEVREDLRKTREELTNAKSAERKLQDDVDSLQKQVDSNEKQMKTNENVIDWLNRQLNDLQVKQQPVTKGSVNSLHPPFNPVYTSSNSSNVANKPSYAASLNLQHSALKGNQLQTVKENPGTDNEEPPLDPRYFMPTPASSTGNKNSLLGGGDGLKKSLPNSARSKAGTTSLKKKTLLHSSYFPIAPK